MLGHQKMRSEKMTACVVSHISFYGLLVSASFAALVNQYQKLDHFSLLWLKK